MKGLSDAGWGLLIVLILFIFMLFTTMGRGILEAILAMIPVLL